MTALLKTSMRMRPDRILVGEVRGPEALDLLMAWNTGHPGGIATLHANTASSGLTRLELPLDGSRFAGQLPQKNSASHGVYKETEKARKRKIGIILVTFFYYVSPFRGRPRGTRSRKIALKSISP
jgi:Flp pilus assembly CpaF family ATPase